MKTIAKRAERRRRESTGLVDPRLLVFRKVCNHDIELIKVASSPEEAKHFIDGFNSSDDDCEAMTGVEAIRFVEEGSRSD